MNDTPREPDEFVLGLVRLAGLEATYLQFPDDVLAAVSGARQEREKLEADRSDLP
jgi:hypothetical protein